jgi:membrane fusion protein (multidrug efflux system)
MDQAIAVPQRAVQMNSNGAFVLAVNDENKVAPMPVQLGPMSGDKWVISGGLPEGARIVVDGVQKAKPGSVVKPVDPANPAASAASMPMAVPAASAVNASPVASVAVTPVAVKPASAPASTALQAGR